METGNQVKSIVYLTVNTVNNKIYVGIHITNKPFEFDGYYGNGITGTSCYHFKHPKTLFQRACKKYGLNVFRRYTLFVYDTYEEAQEMERQIVTEEFVNRPDTYNIALGGGAGRVPEAEIPICQYDLQGKFIQKFRSKNEAARQVGCNIMSIISAELAKGVCQNFYWSQLEVPILDITNYIEPIKEIYIYNLDGTYLMALPNKAACAKKFGVNLSCINRAVDNGYKSAGHYFSYEKVDKFIPVKKKRTISKEYSQYTLEGNYIQTLSVQDVKKLLGKDAYKLPSALKEHYSCGGFLWSKEKADSIKPLKAERKKKIAQYDLNGNLIKIWDSYRECAEQFHNLRYVLKGARNQTKGYCFRYIDNNLKDIV